MNRSAPPEPLAAAGSTAPATAISRELHSALASARRAARAELALLRLGLFDFGLRATAFASAALLGVAAALAALGLAIGSVRDGLARWSGLAWWSDLVLAALLVLGLFGGARWWRLAVHRATLLRVQHKAQGTTERPAA